MEVFSMKKVLAGGFMMLSGILLFIGVHIPAAQYSSKLTGWTTPPGRYGTAIIDTGGTSPLIISIILCFLGLLLMIWGSVIDQFIKYKSSSTNI